MKGVAAGVYTISLTARAGAYDGAPIGTSTATATLGTTTSIPVTFTFPSTPTIVSGTLVTFAITPADLLVYYNVRDASAAAFFT